MPSYEKLQCRLTATYIIVACDGDLQRKNINTDDHLSICNCSGAGLSSTKQSSSASVDLHGAHFRGWNNYAGTYTANMSTMVLIFADGAQIRARICVPVHVYAEGNEYAVTPALSYQAYQSVDRQREYTTKRNETMAIFRGGEEGIGWLIVKVLRVALWEGEKREKCFKSRSVMVGNKNMSEGFR